MPPPSTSAQGQSALSGVGAGKDRWSAKSPSRAAARRIRSRPPRSSPAKSSAPPGRVAAAAQAASMAATSAAGSRASTFRATLFWASCHSPATSAAGAAKAPKTWVKDTTAFGPMEAVCSWVGARPACTSM